MLDLDPATESRHRRTAKGWILSNQKTRDRIITFYEVCVALDINLVEFRLRLEKEGKIKLES